MWERWGIEEEAVAWAEDWLMTAELKSAVYKQKILCLWAKTLCKIWESQQEKTEVEKTQVYGLNDTLANKYGHEKCY